MKFLLLISIVLLTATVYPQTDTTYNQLEELNDLLEDITRDNDDSQIFDLIEYYLNNPIRLNTASIRELQNLPYLNYALASAIIRHRNLQGGIHAPEQMKNIEGVGEEVIQKVLPFLILGDEEDISFLEAVSQKFENIKFRYRARTQSDLQDRSAFLENKYYGSKFKFYNRLQLNAHDKIEAGIITEKDAGENSLTDFYAFNLMIKDAAFIKKLILGDFIFEFGQGLALWGPYSFSKSSDAIGSVVRNDRGAVPYLSSDENQFLRGASVSFEIDDLSLTSFLSSHLLDASIDTVTNKINSLLVDGFHRYDNEANHKDIVKEEIFGSAINYSVTRDFRIGLLFYHSQFDREFSANSVLEKAGPDFNLLSLSYSASLNKLFLSGELAYNFTSVASINTAELFIDKNLSLIFSFRNFPKNYYSPHGTSFGEKGTAQNEVGFYSGISLKTAFGNFNFYYDQFKYPLNSDSYLFSSNGSDLLFYYTYKFQPATELRIRYKNESKDILEIINSENGLSKRKSENIRGEILYKPSKNIWMKTRIEYVNLSPTNEQSREDGLLVSQDIKYSLFSKLVLYGRLTLFQSDSYNSRLYVYENDLVGVMSNPALYGEGTRWYCMAKYSSDFGLGLSVKYSETYKPNEKTLGSGDSEIQGNLDNRISLQLDFSF
ncbi:MAG: helix-hairpin-helix domain-containing protein [Bacteroidota bacterium]